MEKELYEYTAQKVDEMLAASSSSQETIDACNAWKEAVAADDGAEAVDAATAKLLDVLDSSHTTVDDLIEFASGKAKELMGEEAAAGMLAHAKEIKEAGAKFCDCAACAASHALLAAHGRPVE